MCIFKRCDFKVFRGQWVNILCIYREGELVRELSLLKVKKKTICHDILAHFSSLNLVHNFRYFFHHQALCANLASKQKNDVIKGSNQCCQWNFYNYC